MIGYKEQSRYKMCICIRTNTIIFVVFLEELKARQIASEIIWPLPEIGNFSHEVIKNSSLWLTWETDLTVDWSFSMLNSWPLHWSLRSAITRSLASKFAEAVSQDKFLAERSAWAASKSLLIVSIWFWYDTIWLVRSVCDLVRSEKKMFD